MFLAFLNSNSTFNLVFSMLYTKSNSVLDELLGLISDRINSSNTLYKIFILQFARSNSSL